MFNLLYKQLRIPQLKTNIKYFLSNLFFTAVDFLLLNKVMHKSISDITTAAKNIIFPVQSLLPDFEKVLKTIPTLAANTKNTTQ